MDFQKRKKNLKGRKSSAILVLWISLLSCILYLKEPTLQIIIRRLDKCYWNSLRTQNWGVFDSHWFTLRCLLSETSQRIVYHCRISSLGLYSNLTWPLSVKNHLLNHTSYTYFVYTGICFHWYFTVKSEIVTSFTGHHRSLASSGFILTY